MGSEDHSPLAPLSPSRSAGPSGSRERLPTHSGGTAPDSHRLPCYALDGHPSILSPPRSVPSPMVSSAAVHRSRRRSGTPVRHAERLSSVRATGADPRVQVHGQSRGVAPARARRVRRRGGARREDARSARGARRGGGGVGRGPAGIGGSGRVRRGPRARPGCGAALGLPLERDGARVDATAACSLRSRRPGASCTCRRPGVRRAARRRRRDRAGAAHARARSGSRPAGRPRRGPWSWLVLRAAAIYGSAAGSKRARGRPGAEAIPIAWCRASTSKISRRSARAALCSRLTGAFPAADRSPATARGWRRSAPRSASSRLPWRTRSRTARRSPRRRTCGVRGARRRDPRSDRREGVVASITAPRSPLRRRRRRGRRDRPVPPRHLAEREHGDERRPAKEPKYAAPSSETGRVKTAVSRFQGAIVRSQSDMIVLRIAFGACV